MAFVRRPSGLWMTDHKRPIGRIDGQIIRDGRVIDEWSQKNLITNEGLNADLNVMLNGSSQITAWYIALFTGNYTPLLTDTAASLPGNATEATAYTSATRPAWQPASASSQSITNSANRASYTFNGGITVYGAFMTSSSVISGTSGTSWAAAQFASSKAVENNDQMLLTWTFTASG